MLINFTETRGISMRGLEFGRARSAPMKPMLRKKLNAKKPKKVKRDLYIQILNRLKLMEMRLLKIVPGKNGLLL